MPHSAHRRRFIMRSSTIIKCNLIWAKSFGDGSLNSAYSVCLYNSGNMYISGCFDGTVDFNPGSGTTLLSSNRFRDIFILKLDTVGNFIWAKSIGGISSDYSYSISTDSSDNVYTTGNFGGTVDFAQT